MIVRHPSGFIKPLPVVESVRTVIKHDGYRLMVRRDGERVCCFLVTIGVAESQQTASPSTSGILVSGRLGPKSNQSLSLLVAIDAPRQPVVFKATGHFLAIFEKSTVAVKAHNFCA